MKQFTSVQDVLSVDALIDEALSIKADAGVLSGFAKGKTLGMLFMNPSLRTRMSTQKAAQMLGMQVIVLSATADAWKLEFEDGAVMNGTGVEHIKDAAAVMGLYCDVIGLRCFPGLHDRAEDDSEHILNGFIRYCNKPVLSLESATLHPLQSLADLITIKEQSTAKRPKVVLSWAPHIKPLPQAVANSFAEWMLGWNQAEFVIACPAGYELSERFTAGVETVHDARQALESADFVYYKNWSSYSAYGQMPLVSGDWYPDAGFVMERQIKVMHCLPVRRNVEVPDALLDGPDALVLQQAENRVYAAAAVLKNLLT